MIHQSIKDLYYSLLYPCSYLLKPVYKLHYRALRNQCHKVHVGCGKNYLEGFINIDANFQRRVDYLLDTRAGLPFPDDSVEIIYSCHMLEHVHVTEAIEILKEWRRILSPAGYVRLTLPDFNYIFHILSGQAPANFPRSFDSRHGQAINFLFCDGQHKYAYSPELIEELALGLGFSKVVPASQEDCNISDLTSIEPGGSFSVNLFK
jgi:prepilin-type processing-associated H-X9-DG protein